jgi:hypothetical protein
MKAPEHMIRTFSLVQSIWFPYFYVVAKAVDNITDVT